MIVSSEYNVACGDSRVPAYNTEAWTIYSYFCGLTHLRHRIASTVTDFGLHIGKRA